MKIEYSESYLSLIIEHYIETVYKKHDWEIVAIDVIKNIVVLKRQQK